VDPGDIYPPQSHIKFGESTMKPKDLDVLKRFGYIDKKEDDMTQTMMKWLCSEAFSRMGFVFRCMK
jgi:hypothetical protein